MTWSLIMIRISSPLLNTAPHLPLLSRSSSVTMFWVWLQFSHSINTSISARYSQYETEWFVKFWWQWLEICGIFIDILFCHHFIGIWLFSSDCLRHPDEPGSAVIIIQNISWIRSQIIFTWNSFIVHGFLQYKYKLSLLTTNGRKIFCRSISKIFHLHRLKNISVWICCCFSQ